MIRRSLKDFFNKYKDDIDLNLSSVEKTHVNKWLETKEFHSILRQQITMNPIPKRIKQGISQSARINHEAHYIKECSERVSLVRSSPEPSPALVWLY